MFGGGGGGGGGGSYTSEIDISYTINLTVKINIYCQISSTIISL